MLYKKSHETYEDVLPIEGMPDLLRDPASRNHTIIINTARHMLSCNNNVGKVIARCARVSYLTHDGVRNTEKDLELYTRLTNGSGTGHWSPFEHVARAEANLIRSGNLIGYTQFRKMFKNENQRK